jgi:hypothetical protein
MLARIRDDADVSYQLFSDPDQLRGLLESDLAVLLSERFQAAQPHDSKRRAIVRADSPDSPSASRTTVP